MSVIELAKLVAEMRNAQKEHFRTFSPTALERAKALERQVDQECKDLLEQPRLFDPTN